MAKNLNRERLECNETNTKSISDFSKNWVDASSIMLQANESSPNICVQIKIIRINRANEHSDSICIKKQEQLDCSL